MRRAMWLLVLAIVVRLANAQQAPFTIEAVMSAPFPSEIVAAPAGGHVAWVQNARGARNLWIAAAPDFKPRQLTSYTEDDGQAIADLKFTSDGRTVVYVRGGGPNRQGEVPNPTIAAEAPEQAIWAVDLAGGAPRKLAGGSAPAVSATGRVAYVVRGQVWATSMNTSEKPVQLFNARGQARDLCWSPDGKRLAFVSSRGDHSFVGVFEPETRTIRYLDPSVDRDGNPAWSPDGGRLAFTRIAAMRDTFSFAPHREGEPWSIRVADVSTGAGREAWRAERRSGSVFQGVAAGDQIQWAAGDRLVFPWEREGWLNLYSITVAQPLGTTTAEKLTPGPFEVEHVTLSADRTRIIYSSNQDDLDRRHIWSVAVRGGRPVPITSGKGIEWMPAAVSDGSIAFLRSTATLAAHAAILPAGAAQARALAPATMPSEFPAAQLVEPQEVMFAAPDGVPIHAQLFVPREVKAGERRPGVIFFHGGSRRQMLLGWHYLDYYHNAYAFNQYLASRGYVVLSVNYRSGIGYGLNFREALNYGATGASEFNDVMGAGLYMKGRPDVDPQRIGLWGGSYGGFLTAMGLARASDLFAAGVDFHGAHDWNVIIKNFVPTYEPTDAIARRNFQASPMAYISGWKSPVLLIHGDDDRNVPFSETVDIVEALRKQGVTLEQLVLPDEIHGFLRHDSWVRAYRASADFLDRYLKGRKVGTN